MSSSKHLYVSQSMISLGREAQLLDFTQIKDISYMIRAGISYAKKTVKVIVPYLIFYVLWPHICGARRCGNDVIVSGRCSLFVLVHICVNLTHCPRAYDDVVYCKSILRKPLNENLTDKSSDIII